MTARQKLESFIAKQTDEMLLAGITKIAKLGENVSMEERVIRGGLLNEYETRNGGSATELLMDTLGM